jgi:hypothetical protein
MDTQLCSVAAWDGSRYAPAHLEEAYECQDDCKRGVDSGLNPLEHPEAASRLVGHKLP